MLAEAEAVNLGFLKRMRTGFPYVQLKLGASLDGRTAMASGESQWITSPEARQDVQRLRAQSAAILSTSATVLADDPSLTVRWDELDAETQRLYPRENLRQPLRILLDSQNRITPQHRVVQQPGATWLARLQADEQAWPQDVEQFICPAHGGGVDLVVMMMLLAKRQVNSIWVEAGAALAGALLQAAWWMSSFCTSRQNCWAIMAAACVICRAWSIWPTRRNSSLATCGRLAPICVCACGRNTESRARAPVLQKRRAGDERI